MFIQFYNFLIILLSFSSFLISIFFRNLYLFTSTLFGVIFNIEEISLEVSFKRNKEHSFFSLSVKPGYFFSRLL